MLAIELPKDMNARLERISEMTGRSKADHAREALAEYIEAWEGELLSAEAVNALREAEEDITSGRTLSLQDFRRGTGL